ncbi:AraC family transcriptional regulator [Phreatobacter sp.]|uniref:AraC family transcriptional regulator n=1 Tax=Phreatobacter sp. TaxID=1966341 RepID=UPI003F700B4C
MAQTAPQPVQPDFRSGRREPRHPPLLCFSGHQASGRRAEALQNVQRPVVAMAAEFANGEVGTRHCHRRGQFLHGLTGIMTVITDDGSWAVAPQHALWIPPGVMHQTRCWGAVSLRTIYIEPAAAIGLPGTCQLMEISPLLRELLNEAVALPTEYETGGRDGAIIDLILAEIRRMPELVRSAPMPKDRRLARICEAILRDPGNNHDLDHWARYGGLGRRTLTRLFRHETGMSFVQWRQQVRLMEALSRLTAGEAVTHVALDLGYDSPSAFSAMFRRTMGLSPRDYLRWGDPCGGAMHD